MKKIIISVSIMFFALLAPAQSYKKVHKKAILVDTHNDILTKTVDWGYLMDTDLRGKAHSDLARWKEGGLDMQIFSVFCDGDKIEPYAYANRQMDSLDRVLKSNPDKIVKVTNTNEMLKIIKQHKIAAMFGVEGGHMIENDSAKLDHFYQRGARYMTITWNNSTPWATSAYDETFNKELLRKGLTDFGKQIIHKMNSMGMMVDISHVGEQTFWDIIKITTKPVIATHSSVYAICPHQRNLKDDQIKAIAKNGGVIQVNFYSGFLDSSYMKRKDVFLAYHKSEADSLTALNKAPDEIEDYLYRTYQSEVEKFRAPFLAVIQHIDYIVKLVGVDYVGIGSDYDGVESVPMRLDDVTTYPLITEAMLARGYSKKDVYKILGGNFIRVLEANEKGN